MPPEQPLNVLQVATSDIHGGAQMVAWNLFTTYRKLGHQSYLAVGRKYSSDQDVIELSDHPQSVSIRSALATSCEMLLSPAAERFRAAKRLRTAFRDLRRGWRAPFDRFFGREDFNYPGSRRLLATPGNGRSIIHCHNLHGAYFDLSILPLVSSKIPVVLTLHDSWLLTGHCAQSFDCARWKTGCGYCPDLSIYPAVMRDSTAYNWRRKRDIYARSKLYVSAPSRWLMQRVGSSILAPAVRESKLIPNGADLSVFRPLEDRDDVRMRLGIDVHAKLVVFAADSIRRNVFKDYATFRAAIAELGAQWSGPPLLFIALGDDAPVETIGRAQLRFVPFQHNVSKVAEYLGAADVYVHPARADTFPNTVIEALACGTPVVASAVGGIPEQIDDNKTGFLVTPGDGCEMATRIDILLRDEDLRRQMAESAEATARRHFDLNAQADAYLAWYRSILDC